jgi:hypothetical protein
VLYPPLGIDVAAQLRERVDADLHRENVRRAG